VGERETEPFQFTFKGSLKVAFQGSRVTSDAGLILVRELDERLGLEAIMTEHLRDSRHGLNTQLPSPDLLRQSIYSRLAGYEDLNDAARLSADPTFRLIGSPMRWDRSAPLTSTLYWFETELLTREENLVGLVAVNRDVIGQAETLDRSDCTVLDMDSSESPAPVRVDAPADLGATHADRLTGERCRRPWAERECKAGEVSVRMSGHRAARHNSGDGEGITTLDPRGRNFDPSASAQV